MTVAVLVAVAAAVVADTILDWCERFPEVATNLSNPEN